MLYVIVGIVGLAVCVTMLVAFFAEVFSNFLK
jgi:hypothetical protein